MADVKFSPKPWRSVGYSYLSGVKARNGDKGFKILDREDRIVTVVHSGDYGGNSFEQQAANAYLIAAAPEMYEALKEAHRYFRNRPGNEEKQLAEILGAAITKAEGRQ